MKVWNYVLVFVMSSLVAVDSQTCPSEHFSTVFTGTIDQIVDDPTQIYIDDPELTFFRTYMKFRDADIRHVTDDAIQYFNNTYGLDFSNSPPNEKFEHFFQNARLAPVTLAHDRINYIVTDNHWVRTGNTRSTCYLIRDGGFRVTFTGDQTLYGSYGGAEGKPAGIFNTLFYGFYNIDVCKQSPIIIQYQSRPARPEPVDGINTVSSDLYNNVLGNGKLYALFQIYPDPAGSGKFRFILRSVLTFPAQ